VTDHLEELQRKCLKHARKPLSSQLLEEMKNGDGDKEKEKKDGDDDMEEAGGDKEDDKEKEKDKIVKKEGGQRSSDNRDWKRNGNG
jgi:Ran GTPase-activating protein (RanGAP) involved in mRNA processing and transport